MLKVNKSKLVSILDKLSLASVLVIGDIILDEFIVGSPERISREAPVIILEHISSDYALGGASNAAHNISSIKGKCNLIGVVGEDLYAKALENECLKNNINPILSYDKNRPTTVKTRILSTAHKHPTSSIIFKQQLLRLDRLSRKNLSSNVEKELIDIFQVYIKKVKAILISDYDLGVCSNKIIKILINIANKNRIPVIVDAASNFSRFKGAFLITPNQPDTEAAVGFSITNKDSLLKAGKKLLKISGTKNVLITRGSEGMALFNAKNPNNPFLLPAFNVSEVFDVTGAGDTVAGTISAVISVLGVSSEQSLPLACVLGNLAASIVVTKYGTAVTSVKELKSHLQTVKLSS